MNASMHGDMYNCASNLNLTHVYYASLEGNGKQTNRLDLVFPNSTVPDSDFATLSVIGKYIFCYSCGLFQILPTMYVVNVVKELIINS